MALSVQEFSAKIKQKYPEYQNVDDFQLAQKVVAKYPEYAGKVDLGQPKQGGGFNPLEGVGNFLQGVGNFGQQAGNEVVRGAGNVVNTAGAIVDPVANINRLGRTVRGQFTDDPSMDLIPRQAQIVEGGTGLIKKGTDWIADTNQRASQNITGKGEGDFSTVAGRNVGGGAIGFATSALTGGGATNFLAKMGGVASKAFPGLANVTNKIAPVATNGGKVTFGQRLTQGVSKLPELAARSTGETQGYLATQGKLATPSDIATGAIFDAGFAGLGKLGKKIGGAAFDKAIPATKGQRDVDVASGLKIGKTIQEQVPNVPIFGGQKGLEKSITKRVKELSNEFGQYVDAADLKRQGGDQFDLLTADLGKKIANNPKLKIAADEMEEMAGKARQVVDYYRANFPNLNLKAQDKLKKDLYNTLDSYYSKLAPKSENVKSITRAEIAKSLKENINKTVEQVLGKAAGKRVKDLNEIRSNLIPAKTRLKNQKGKYSGYLTDVIAGSQGAAQGLGELNLGKAVSGIATAVGLKRALTSPALMTAVGALSQKRLPSPVKNFIRNKVIGD